MDNTVKLRPLTEADLPLMAEYANNEKLAMNLRDGFPHPYTLQAAKNFFEFVYKPNQKTIFAIEFNGEYAGNISLIQGMDVYRKSAEIGYFIAEPFWNKGIASQAVKLICEFGFANLDIVRIHTGVFEYNIASQRVLEKCKFTKEGIFKKSVCKMDKVWDEDRFALLKDDFLK